MEPTDDLGPPAPLAFVIAAIVGSLVLAAIIVYGLGPPR